MKAKIITVTLNPAVDKMIPLPRFSKRARVAAKGVSSAGGKGINVSRALKCLKAQTVAVGIIGGASGGELKRIINKEKLAFDFLEIKGETRTNITFGDKPTRSRLRLTGKGPEVNRDVLKRFERKLKKNLKGCSLAVISGRNAQGAPANYYARLVRSIKARNIVVALDTSGTGLKEGLKAKPDIIKPNLQEAQRALGKTFTSLKEIKSAVKNFHDKGIKVVLITLGRRGVVAGFKGQIWYCRPPEIRVKHEVGCGDAFLAGYIYAAGAGYHFCDALRFAVSCGSINCQGAVPGLINKSKVKSFIQKIKTKQL